MGEDCETRKNMLCPLLIARDTIITNKTFLNEGRHMVSRLTIANGMCNGREGC